MRCCPKCNRIYKDDKQVFCTHDGGRLQPFVNPYVFNDVSQTQDITPGTAQNPVHGKDIPAKYIYLDVVGFTRGRSVEAQARVVEVLNSIVYDSIKKNEFSFNNLLFMPTGDGMCIALLRVDEPFDIHMLIALSIINRIHGYNTTFADEKAEFKVRVGINSNIDIGVIDINRRQNIAGAGISMASRIMDKADGNQILVGEPVYQTLNYRDKYMNSFRLYKAEIKHGDTINIYQFIKEGHLGLNIDIPKAFQNS